MKFSILAVVLALGIDSARAESGLASFYGGIHHGSRRADGGVFDQESNTCAHRSLPFGTQLRVTRAGGHSVICIVRDRGPFIKERILDLSRAGARHLGMIGQGVARVSVAVMWHRPQRHAR